MRNIYQSSLDERFAMIMKVIVQDDDIGGILNGLTVDPRVNAKDLAEQAIINWATARKNMSPRPRPLTNLQHLLAEYCALAEHL